MNFTSQVKEVIVTTVSKIFHPIYKTGSKLTKHTALPLVTKAFWHTSIQVFDDCDAALTIPVISIMFSLLLFQGAYLAVVQEILHYLHSSKQLHQHLVRSQGACLVLQRQVQLALDLAQDLVQVFLDRARVVRRYACWKITVIVMSDD